MGIYRQPLPQIIKDYQLSLKSRPGCIAYTIVNKGTSTVIWNNNYPINPGDSPLAATGELEIQSVDILKITFSGGGTNSCYIILTIDEDLETGK